MADPGVPVGGFNLVGGGGTDYQGGYVSKILYVETKESGPLDPPMGCIRIHGLFAVFGKFPNFPSLRSLV